MEETIVANAMKVYLLICKDIACSIPVERKQLTIKKRVEKIIAKGNIYLQVNPKDSEYLYIKKILKYR